MIKCPLVDIEGVMQQLAATGSDKPDSVSALSGDPLKAMQPNTTEDNTMTKKDYEMIATAFAKHGTTTPDDADDYTKGLYLGRRDAIYTLSEVLRKNNPRFDQDRFLTACGL